MNVCHHHVALKSKITAPTSQVHINALHVVRDLRPTKTQWKKEDVLVCTQQEFCSEKLLICLAVIMHSFYSPKAKNA